jgi:hypothetical protein
LTRFCKDPEQEVPVTEQEWAACQAPQKMLDWLRDIVRSDARRLRLVAVACLRNVWHLLDDPASCRKALAFAERYADGLATLGQLRGRAWGKSGGAWPAMLFDAWVAAQTAAEYGAALAAWAAVAGDAPTMKRWQVALDAAWGRGDSPSEAQAAADAAVADAAEWLAAREAARRQEEQTQAAILRCIFGGPLWKCPLEPSLLTWQGGTIPRLAQAAYDDRLPEGTLDPGRLAVLCDAAEESGLADAELLGHLRGPLHWRGCFAVDWLLGKA